MGDDLTAAALAIVDKLIPLAAVGLGWLLGTRSQRRQRRLDALNGRFEALRQLMEVADNVPHDLGADELFQRLVSNKELQRSLAHRLTHLLSLRRELPPYLEPKIREFIDGTFRPLFDTAAGSAKLDDARIREFAAAAVSFRDLVMATERDLEAKHVRLQR